ncbi:MAG: tetratricopeptide repeat protein [Devosia sp.]|uniref:tetratricopeptide repeat protein n=1 Tax=Devosia sp. TaxID=1871048 RepID=UPI00260E8F86|nr:tetratricopeptide repeat protein [Devosia sp.]MDB5538522.1 tetratricopeptide repeat protein [Devosia sp.]
MNRRFGRAFRHGLAAITIMALPLSGCSTGNLGGLSTFGNNKVQIAEVNDIGSYTADTALVQARSHFRNNDYGYSAAFYKRAVELSPKDPEGYVGLSASYDRLGRFDLADRVYASLYDLSGGTVQYYNNVGYSYMLRGNLTEAMRNFRKAMQLAPDNVVVANNIQILKQAAAASRA